MLEFRVSDREGFLIVRLEGLQSIAEFGATGGRTIAKHSVSQQPLRVLFDWISLEGWLFDVPAMTSWQDWHRYARHIERGAIVHARHWDRQAAILAAILRVNACLVRSWTPEDMKPAIAWLKGGTQCENMSILTLRNQLL